MLGKGLQLKTNALLVFEKLVNNRLVDHPEKWGFLHKLKSYGTLGQIFVLILSFLSNRQLPVILDGKSSQEYSVNAGVTQGSILGPTLFLYINDLLGDINNNITIYADTTTLYWSGTWFVATARIGFWSWTWSTRP